MRGKKIDKEYISDFIEASIQNGKSSLEEILQDVSSKIANIDSKIVEAESLKKERAKLLHVREFLGKTLL